MSEDGDFSELILRDNNTYCSIYIKNGRIITETNCVKLTNSKHIKIVCTPQKKVCKTENEIFEFIDDELKNSLKAMREYQIEVMQQEEQRKEQQRKKQLREEQQRKKLETIDNKLLKDGSYSWNKSNSEASLNIKKEENGAFKITGDALYGVLNKFGPNIAKISFTAFMRNRKIIYSQSNNYIFTLKIHDNGSFSVTEKGVSSSFGRDVSFSGYFTSDKLPSFSCNKENTLIEKTICSDIYLATLDKKMALEYSRLLGVSSVFNDSQNIKLFIERNHKIWRETLNQCNQKEYKECLKITHETRVENLRKQFIDFMTLGRKQDNYIKLINNYNLLSKKHKEAGNQIKSIACSMEIDNLKIEQRKEYNNFVEKYQNNNLTVSLNEDEFRLKESCKKIETKKDETNDIRNRVQLRKEEVQIRSNLIPQIKIHSILADYENNEIRADNKYRHKKIQTTGIIIDMGRDLVDKLYVTLGTGKFFELPAIQAYFSDEMSRELGKLQKGTNLTIRCSVDGLLMNVIMSNCTIISKP